MPKIYDHILQGSEATEEQALDHARGLDWSEIEVHEGPRNLIYSNYINTINGIDIWYNIPADYYWFSEEEAYGED